MDFFLLWGDYCFHSGTAIVTVLKKKLANIEFAHQISCQFSLALQCSTYCDQLLQFVLKVALKLQLTRTFLSK